MEFGTDRIPTGSPRQRVSFGVCNVIIPRMIQLSATWRCGIKRFESPVMHWLSG
ncbi:hypothetical protein HanPSC8_Chr10g0408291 [Helianthus annuus]|nr:hypothetical protein HanPSC8_Chr10g0408291 [Helianthus annuus]